MSKCEKKCEDCIHCGLCLNIDRLTLFDKNQPAHCKAFKDKSLFVELPCKENQEIYIISNRRIITTYARTFNYLGAEIGLEIHTSRYEKDRKGWLTLKNKIVHENEFGKTVFLTKEEAEKKLKEMG